MTQPTPRNMQAMGLYTTMAKAIVDARPISNDKLNLGVQAAHHALDMAAHFLCDRAAGDPSFDRQNFLAVSDTPDNRFAR